MELKPAKKIVLITSGQPSLNPRLVKEADALAEAGYEVTVLYAYWNNWGTKADELLLSKKKWTSIRVAGDPVHQSTIFFLSRLTHKIALAMADRSHRFADLSIARSSWFLIREAKKQKADLYIGHNLGALPAVIAAAKKYTALSGFDAEDFHRNEISDDDDDAGVRLKTRIEDRYIKQLDYLSTSSPLISEAYSVLYPEQVPFTILNVFPVGESVLLPSKNDDNKLRLVWFSQVVSHGRGLTDCLNALKALNNPAIELNLLGFTTEETKQEFNAIAQGHFDINFIDPVSPDEIIPLASKFDIGIAPEDTAPRNRDICLTNKVFTYMQAGLAIVASDTKAQKALLSQYPGAGMIYQKKDLTTLQSIISHYFSNREELLKAKKTSLKIAREELNWARESKKFIAHIKAILPA